MLIHINSYSPAIMGNIRFISILSATIIMLVSSLASAGDDDKTYMRFEAYWGGLHIADFTLSSRKDGKAYKNRFVLRTRGLTELIMRLRLAASGEGRTDPLRPSNYRVDYTNRRRQRSVKVRFDAGDTVATPTIRTIGASMESDREKENKVPPKYRTNVMDPIAALLAVFRNARKAANGGQGKFSLAVYDGRRRFDLNGEFLGKGSRTILGKKHKTYRLRLSATPIIGFKERHTILWKEMIFDVYFSADGNFTPLQFVPLKTGPIINLIEKCSQPCKLADMASEPSK